MTDDDNVTHLRPVPPAPRPRPQVTGREATLALLTHEGAHGVTWGELATYLSVHHGAASGILSNLHRKGRIARLAYKRGGSKIYVLPDYVNGRLTEGIGRVGERPLLDELARILAAANLRHDHLPSVVGVNCLACDAEAALRKYRSQ